MRGDGRIFKRGRKYWIAYYHRGEEHREAVGYDEAAARRLLRQRLVEVLGGRFVPPRSARCTVDELLDGYMESCVIRGRKSVRRLEDGAWRGSIASALVPVRAAFGADRLADVTAARIARWVADRLRAGAAPGTVYNEAGYFRAALHLAVKEGRLPAAPHVPAITVRNTRQGFFERDEFEHVAEQLAEPFDDVARFAYGTGWRIGEVLGLQWSQVDRAHGVVRLGDSKNGEGRVLPLVGGLATLIEGRWQARRSGDRIAAWVFHRAARRIPYATWWHHWRAATAAAGQPGKLIHDCRRTAARDIIDAGGDPYTAMQITGHRSLSMFQRYKIVDVRRMAQVLAGTEAYRAKQETPGGSGAVIELRP